MSVFVKVVVVVVEIVVVDVVVVFVVVGGGDVLIMDASTCKDFSISYILPFFFNLTIHLKFCMKIL